jgi:hypothetical protein
MASLRNIEDVEDIEKQFIGIFGVNSDNHHTWGKTEDRPISATKRARKKARMSMAALMGMISGRPAQSDSPEPIIPNSPDRSIFLRLPLEIREKIYARFLTFKMPVITQNDWQIVENKKYRKDASNDIMFVCKQIYLETTSFLYKNNSFRAILRPAPSNLFYYDTVSIDARFLPLFKTVVITCERENYHLDWYKKACASIKRLSDANVHLDSITLVTSPKRVGMSETAVGLERKPITFADFFYAQGQLMSELRMLHCKVLNVVVKKVDLKISDDAEDAEDASTCRLLISLDLRYLHTVVLQESELTNEETIKIRREKVEMVEKKLLDLKETFEAVFVDGGKAIAEGKCVLLDPDQVEFNGWA